MRIRHVSSAVILGLLCALASPLGAQDAERSGSVPADGKKVNLPEFKQPVFVTDVGQGNTARLVEVMLRRGGKIQYKSEPLGSAKDLGDAKTLLIGVGGSTKGLGAAGLEAGAETERMKSLIEAARKNDMAIIGVHMGGMPRRGELSDPFNRHVFENSDLFILWEGGNEDGFFTRLNEAKKDASARPLLVSVEKKPDVGQQLENYLAPNAEPGEKPGAGTEKKTE
jgi:hypothetical protein